MCFRNFPSKSRNTKNNVFLLFWPPKGSAAQDGRGFHAGNFFMCVPLKAPNPGNFLCTFRRFLFCVPLRPSESSETEKLLYVRSFYFFSAFRGAAPPAESLFYVRSWGPEFYFYFRFLTVTPPPHNAFISKSCPGSGRSQKSGYYEGGYYTKSWIKIGATGKPWIL